MSEDLVSSFVKRRVGMDDLLVASSLRIHRLATCLPASLFSSVLLVPVLLGKPPLGLPGCGLSAHK